jgi:hypothetical protein
MGFTASLTTIRSPLPGQPWALAALNGQGARARWMEHRFVLCPGASKTDHCRHRPFRMVPGRHRPLVSRACVQVGACRPVRRLRGRRLAALVGAGGIVARAVRAAGS